MQRSKQSGHRSKVWQFWQHLRPAAVLSGQFNSSTPGGLLCTALASSGEKRQEARRAFALRVTRHAIPPSRGADAVHVTLAHRYAIFLCSLDVEILPITRPNKSSWATIVEGFLLPTDNRMGLSCTLFMLIRGVFGLFSTIVLVKKYSE